MTHAIIKVSDMRMMLLERIMKLHWRRALTKTTITTTRRWGGLFSLVLFVPLALLLIQFIIIFATNTTTTSSIGSGDKINANDSHYASFNSQNHNGGEELLPIYELPSRSLRRFFFFTTAQYRDPPHLTPIDPSTLVYKGASPIDKVHLNGYLHTGHVLFIMDASRRVLFLQRSANVVTCPNTWSALGEHTSIDDGSPWETVIRGIEEELGFRSFGHDTKEFPMVWTADLHPSHITSSIKTRGANPLLPIRITIRNVTEYPVYYIRHYGARNEYRVDRQLTYLWLVYFPKKEELISWKLDEEVADSKWVSLEDVASWLSNDDANVVARGRSSGNSHVGSDQANEGNSGPTVVDDGPDQGDFCHDTIRSLYEVALAKMIQM